MNTSEIGMRGLLPQKWYHKISLDCIGASGET